MNKGKTIYNFQINCVQQLIDQIITEWLSSNKFRYENKYGEEAYYFHDAWNGNRGFQYNVNNGVLSISVWTIGMGDTFYMLDSGAVNNMAGDSYKNLLSSLFSKINELGNINSIQSNYIQPNQSAQNISQFTKSFIEENDKKKEKLCNIGFWLSIAGLFLALIGMTYGIIIYIANFYLATQGLKTKNSGKAIATFIISVISIIIVMLQIILI